MNERSSIRHSLPQRRLSSPALCSAVEAYTDPEYTKCHGPYDPRQEEADRSRSAHPRAGRRHRKGARRGAGVFHYPPDDRGVPWGDQWAHGRNHGRPCPLPCRESGPAPLVRPGQGSPRAHRRHQELPQMTGARAESSVLEREHRQLDDHHPTVDTTDLLRIGLVALAVVVSWAHPWQPFAAIDVVALVATLAGGYPIFREATEALLQRRMTMELSMTIALGAALAIGEAFTALVIVLFVLIAEVLEHLTVGRGRGAIKDLLDFLPHQITLRRGDVTQEVRSTAIAVGDVVIVKPGGHIPVDG